MSEGGESGVPGPSGNLGGSPLVRCAGQQRKVMGVGVSWSGCAEESGCDSGRAKVF